MCGSLRFNLENHTPTPWLILGIAGWMVYVSEQDEKGEKIIVNDPMLEQIREANSDAGTAEEIVLSLLKLHSIFGEDLIQNKTFVSALIETVNQLKKSGAQAVVVKTLESN